MNERIKEFVKQSGGEFWQRIESDGVLNREAYITFDPPQSLEKFAELVEKNVDFSEPYLSGKADARYETIHECIELLWQVGNISGAQLLEKHFGVEE